MVNLFSLYCTDRLYVMLKKQMEKKLTVVLYSDKCLVQLDIWITNGKVNA